MANSLSGNSAAVPTWEYVQNVISSNIGKSEDAISVAYAHMGSLAEAYEALQNGDWTVDTDVGTNTDIAWPGGGLQLVPSVEEPETPATPADVEVRKTQVQLIDPGVAPAWSVETPDTPDAIGGAAFSAIPQLPAVPVINVSIPTMSVPEAAHGFTPSAAPTWDVDLSGAPEDIADPSLSPVASLGAVPAIEATVTGLDVAKATGPDVPIEAPQWDAELGERPEELDPLALSGVAQLDALPLIDVTIPVMDIALLDESFDFTEQTYVERVSAEIQANLQTVLGGEVGLPQGYWDSLWSEASNDFARLQAGELRNARNRGAASHWGLPSETVLVASRAIQDEGSRKIQAARLEMAKQQAVMAREDYWQAITQGMAYEQIWVAQSDRINQRALAAAEQAVGLSVSVYNANVARFNARLSAAQLDGTINQMRVQRLLNKHSQMLQSNQMEISQDKAKVDRWLGEWQGRNTEGQLAITNMAERARSWGVEIDARVKVAGLDLDTTKTNMDRYRGILEADKLEGTFDELAIRRTLDSHNAQLSTNQTEIAADKAVLDRWLGKWDGFKTEKTLDVSSLTEQTKAWGIALDGDIKHGNLNLDQTKTNIARHQEELKTSQVSLEANVAKVKRLLDSHAANMQTAQTETERDKAVLARWLGEWQGYKLELDANITKISEETKYWGMKVDGAAKLSSQAVNEDKAAIQNYVAQLGKIDTVASSISKLLSARVGQQEGEIRNQAQLYQNAAQVNNAALNVSRLTQAAQETRAKLDIAQKEWLGGQGEALLNNMAQLAVGLAQSLITVSDVNLGSSYSNSDSYSESASHNSEKVW